MLAAYRSIVKSCKSLLREVRIKDKIPLGNKIWGRVMDLVVWVVIFAFLVLGAVTDF